MTGAGVSATILNRNKAFELNAHVLFQSLHRRGNLVSAFLAGIALGDDRTAIIRIGIVAVIVDFIEGEQLELVPGVPGFSTASNPLSKEPPPPVPRMVQPTKVSLIS